jgi:hypothetical protein
MCDLIFHENTPEEVKKILNQYVYNDIRLRLYYGDPDTGHDWMQEYKTTGYIAKSRGHKPIPILMNNSQSQWGDAILDHCIVKIVRIDTKETLYQHSDYYIPELAINSINDPYLNNYELYFEVTADGKEVQARFQFEREAKRYVAFITGERNSK